MFEKYTATNLNSNDVIEKWAKVIKEKMEHPPLLEYFGVKLKVPLKAEIKVGKNLSEMKELEI